MHAPTRIALARSDRIFTLAMIVVLVLVSSTVGASMMPTGAVDRSKTVWIERWSDRLLPIPQGPTTVISESAGRDMVAADLLTEHRCLSEVMYYEARGEGDEGERAVAEVVFHRLASGRYGRTICSVVYAGVRQAACQFSFACDGSRQRPKSRRDWEYAEELAAKILTGEVMLSDETAGAVNYHAVYVRPRWAESFTLTALIGKHMFYRRRQADPVGTLVALRGPIW